MADQPDSPAPLSLRDLRDLDLAEILSIFAGTDPARALRHVAQAAFMRGAMAGRAVSTAAVLGLMDEDRADTMATLSANQERLS